MPARRCATTWLTDCHRAPDIGGQALLVRDQRRIASSARRLITSSISPSIASGTTRRPPDRAIMCTSAAPVALRSSRLVTHWLVSRTIRIDGPLAPLTAAPETRTQFGECSARALLASRVAASAAPNKLSNNRRKRQVGRAHDTHDNCCRGRVVEKHPLHTKETRQHEAPQRSQRLLCLPRNKLQATGLAQRLVGASLGERSGVGSGCGGPPPCSSPLSCSLPGAGHRLQRKSAELLPDQAQNNKCQPYPHAVQQIGGNPSGSVAAVKPSP